MFIKTPIIGYIKGRPIHAIMGGDDTATQDQVVQAFANSQGDGQQTVGEPQQTQQPDPSTSGAGQQDDFVQGVLKDVPENERPIVEKYFQQWNQQVQQRFNSVHSEYENWKPLKDQGIDPSEVQQLIALGESLNASPAETVQAIIEAYGLQNLLTQQQGAPQQPQFQQQAPQQQQGYNQQQYPQQQFQQPQITQQQFQQLPPEQQQQILQTGQVVTPQQQQWFESLPPEVQQRLAMVDTMAQIMVQQQQENEARNADTELDTALKALEQQHGKFDEKWVLTLASQTGDLEGAVKEYLDLENRLKQAGNAASAGAPVVLGSGGGLPASDFNPANLDNKQTKDLVSQMLTKANQERT